MSCSFENIYYTKLPCFHSQQHPSLFLFLPLLPRTFSIQRFSRSHHYVQLGNALQKHFFACSALIMGTLKGSTCRFFNFSAQSQNFKWVSNRPDLP